MTWFVPIGSTWSTSVGVDEVQLFGRGEQVAFAAPFVMDLTNPDRLLAGSARAWEVTDTMSSPRGPHLGGPA